MRSWGNRISQDRKAVGGFLEVGLAMMVITCGITLLLMATVLMQGTNITDQREVLERFAQDLTECILADQEIFQEEGVLRYSSLDLLEQMPLPRSEGVTGYQVRLVLMDQPGGGQVLLAQGLVPEKVLDLMSKKTPICLALSLNEIHPAVLEVLVW
jgi:hypothetical protein